MVDTVDTIILINQPPYYGVRLINLSDGTGESGVVKVDKSGLTDLGGIEPTALDLVRAEWDVGGMTITLRWDHATDDELMVMTGQGSWDYTALGPLRDPTPGDSTGDILLTTSGHTSGDGYNIALLFKMRRAAG